MEATYRPVWSRWAWLALAGALAAQGAVTFALEAITVGGMGQAVSSYLAVSSGLVALVCWLAVPLRRRGYAWDHVGIRRLGWPGWRVEWGELTGIWARLGEVGAVEFALERSGRRDVWVKLPGGDGSATELVAELLRRAAPFEAAWAAHALANGLRWRPWRPRVGLLLVSGSVGLWHVGLGAVIAHTLDFNPPAGLAAAWIILAGAWFVAALLPEVNRALSTLSVGPDGLWVRSPLRRSGGEWHAIRAVAVCGHTLALDFDGRTCCLPMSARRLTSLLGLLARSVDRAVVDEALTGPDAPRDLGAAVIASAWQHASPASPRNLAQPQSSNEILAGLLLVTGLIGCTLLSAPAPRSPLRDPVTAMATVDRRCGDIVYYRYRAATAETIGAADPWAGNAAELPATFPVRYERGDPKHSVPALWDALLRRVRAIRSTLGVTDVLIALGLGWALWRLDPSIGPELKRVVERLGEHRPATQAGRPRAGRRLAVGGVGMVLVMAAIAVMPKGEPRRPAGPDWPGAVTSPAVVTHACGDHFHFSYSVQGRTLDGRTRAGAPVAVGQSIAVVYYPRAPRQSLPADELPPPAAPSAPNGRAWLAIGLLLAGLLCVGYMPWQMIRSLPRRCLEELIEGCEEPHREPTVRSC